MARRPLFALLLAVLLAPSAASDGAGGDAGNTQATAMLIAPGIHTGQRAPFNDTDWYRVEVPTGWLLSAVLRPTLPPSGPPHQASLALFDIAGQLQRDNATATDPVAQVAGGGRGDLYLRVGGSLGLFNYTLDVALVPAPDVVVSRIEVDPPRRDDPPLGPLLPRTWDQVRVMVRNEGAAAGTANVRLRFETPTDGALQFSLMQAIELGPGEMRTVVFALDERVLPRHVGDVEIEATAFAGGLELRQDNNRATVRDHAWVEGHGHGVSLGTF